MQPAILAIDQGTTSTRTIAYDSSLNVICSSQLELAQIYPSDGMVEHDPEEIWRAVVRTVADASGEAMARGFEPVAIGITNQRETVVVWDRDTGMPLHNAIVWQDRRTASRCEEVARNGAATLVPSRTGLLVDPYFSATKIAWILDTVDGARKAAEDGRLACGTIDCFLLWRLTSGRVHKTDVTNASRTNLFNIHTLDWDRDLLDLFDVPRSVLPTVHDCDHDFGVTDAGLFERPIPIRGIAGDQQAALIGQRCFDRGDAKATYGTGGFVLLNTGSKCIGSSHGLISTVAYRIGGKLAYALEGSIFIAGAGVQWLRDGIGLISGAGDTDQLARQSNVCSNVIMVPAFTGLGAPHWLPNTRGAMFGLTRDTGTAEIAAAMLESVAYQSADLLSAMTGDGVRLNSLRVDGGMVVNDWMCQSLADIVGLSVERPTNLETTAAGAALLALQGAGLTDEGILDSAKRNTPFRFESTMPAEVRSRKLENWHSAVQATKLFSAGS